MYPEEKFGGCLVILVCLLILSLIPISISVENFPKETVTGTITDVQIEDGETHFVFQHDGITEVLENNDSLWYGKWNSSDFMPPLQEGGEFELVLVGKRIPFLSAYRNIIHFTRLDDAAPTE